MQEQALSTGEEKWQQTTPQRLFASSRSKK